MPETTSTNVLPETPSVLPETTNVLAETTNVLPEMSQTTNVLPGTTSVLLGTTNVLPESTNVLSKTTYQKLLMAYQKLPMFLPETKPMAYQKNNNNWESIESYEMTNNSVPVDFHTSYLAPLICLEPLCISAKWDSNWCGPAQGTPRDHLDHHVTIPGTLFSGYTHPSNLQPHFRLPALIIKQDVKQAWRN